MKKWIILLATCALCGCATSPQAKRFPADQIEPNYASRLAHVHAKLHEPPFWQPDGSPFTELHTAYRLTVLPSQPYVVCITIHKGQSYDSILRTKVYTWSYKQPMRPDRAEIESEGLVFDESRILSEPKAEAFGRLFHALDLAAEDWPEGFHNFFSWLDGTSFFLEANEFGHYRLIQINDPTTKPLTQEGKDMLIKVFPDLDVESIGPFIHQYLALLKWMAEETDSAVLEEYKRIPNNEIQPTNDPR